MRKEKHKAAPKKRFHRRHLILTLESKVFLSIFSLVALVDGDVVVSVSGCVCVFGACPLVTAVVVFLLVVEVQVQVLVCLLLW